MENLIIQPWYWRLFPLENKTGSDIFASLFLSDHHICTLLESPNIISSDNKHLARYSICAGKPRHIDGKLQMWTPSIGNILPFLKQLLQREKLQNNEINSEEIAKLPFTGGWLGWLGYDLAYEIERLPKIKPDLLPFPVAYWYEPENFAVLDHWEQKLWIATTNPETLDIFEQKLNHKKDIKEEIITSEEIKYLTNKEDYEKAVIQAKKYIEKGDIFQANLSLRFSTKTNGHSWEIYSKLQKINPSPYSSYWQTPWGNMMSCSPERLILVKERIIETRPIAGTRSRGKTLQFDQELMEELLSNKKERAEHIMLVDLERNDLGKVCKWGTVEVDELLTIEKYSHVMHLVSNIRGEMREDCNVIDVIKGVFPGGTITGCPKIRCMEIIEELEPFRRSLFYGSCGYLDMGGNLDLNILIRTLLSQDNIVWGQVGAGIVADSDPEKEWYESLEKAQAQLIALNR